jgi:hypothetical protein
MLMFSHEIYINHTSRVDEHTTESMPKELTSATLHENAEINGCNS